MPATPPSGPTPYMPSFGEGKPQLPNEAKHLSIEWDKITIAFDPTKVRNPITVENFSSDHSQGLINGWVDNMNKIMGALKKAPEFKNITEDVKAVTRILEKGAINDSDFASLHQKIGIIHEALDDICWNNFREPRSEATDYERFMPESEKTWDGWVKQLGGMLSQPSVVTPSGEVPEKPETPLQPLFPSPTPTSGETPADKRLQIKTSLLEELDKIQETVKRLQGNENAENTPRDQVTIITALGLGREAGWNQPSNFAKLLDEYSKQKPPGEKDELINEIGVRRQELFDWAMDPSSYPDKNGFTLLNNLIDSAKKL